MKQLKRLGTYSSLLTSKRFSLGCLHSSYSSVKYSIFIKEVFSSQKLLFHSSNNKTNLNFPRFQYFDFVPANKGTSSSNFQNFELKRQNYSSGKKKFQFSLIQVADFHSSSKSQQEEEDPINNKKYFIHQGNTFSYFPYGQFHSLWKPILFALSIIAFFLWFANSDWKNEKMRERSKKKPTDTQTVGELNQFIVVVAFLNLFVFLAWKIVGQTEFMLKNFLHSTLHKPVYPMVLSNFSHIGGLHFTFNMVASYTFASDVYSALGRNQLISLFMAGGTFASLTSHLFKLAVRDRRPSLGASGAVFALIGASTYLHPHAEVRFIFFPFIPFESQSLLPLVVLFDLAGVYGVISRRWNWGFDHAAHLGGLLFGLLYTHLLVEYEKRRLMRLRKRY